MNKENVRKMRCGVHDGAYNYLSLRRIAIMSLAISLGFHLVFMLAFCFGESILVGQGDKADSRQKEEQTVRPRTDTLQPRPALSPDRGSPRGLHDEPHGFPGEHRRRCVDFPKMSLSVSMGFLKLFVLFLFCRYVMDFGIKKRWKELLAMVLGTTLIMVMLSLLTTHLLLLLSTEPYGRGFIFVLIRDGLIRDLSLMAIVIMACYLLRSLYRQKVIAVENEELRTENIRTHYDALKNQLDPHFLFNSMNTLQSLIELDKEKAGDFVQQLSKVLRYTLQNKDVVSLADEMDCVEAYCSMMQMRYGDHLRFDFRIDPLYNECKVLPLSVQGLVENAIKHNVISAKQPLEVRIETAASQTIEVSNAIQPKIKDDNDGGIGLYNLVERYRLQWNREVEIADDGKRFKVVLPLIGICNNT